MILQHSEKREFCDTENRRSGCSVGCKSCNPNGNVHVHVVERRDLESKIWSSSIRRPACQTSHPWPCCPSNNIGTSQHSKTRCWSPLMASWVRRNNGCSRGNGGTLRWYRPRYTRRCLSVQSYVQRNTPMPMCPGVSRLRRNPTRKGMCDQHV